MSSASRRSLVSITSTARPLTTSPPHSSPPVTRARLPSTPALPMVSEAKRLAYQKRRYYTVHHAQPATRAYAPNMSPSSSSGDHEASRHIVTASLPTSPYKAAGVHPGSRHMSSYRSEQFRVGCGVPVVLVSVSILCC